MAVLPISALQADDMFLGLGIGPRGFNEPQIVDSRCTQLP